MNAQESTTTRPYLIRALHEWCTDNGFTPYLAVRVDDSVQVPREYVKDGEIVLNVGLDATSGLVLGNDFVEFKARFGGKPREIMVPVSRVLAIYARENGQGMAFPPPTDLLGSMDDQGLEDDALIALDALDNPADDERVFQVVPNEPAPDDDGDAPNTPPAAGAARPVLKRIK